MSKKSAQGVQSSHPLIENRDPTCVGDVDRGGSSVTACLATQSVDDYDSKYIMMMMKGMINYPSACLTSCFCDHT